MRCGWARCAPNVTGWASAGCRSGSGPGRVVTAGGRVLGVTALGATIAEAVARAYAATGRLHFPGMRFRRDIGHRAGAAPAARP